MDDTALHEEVRSLSAKVTALTMLVEMLVVGELGRDPDPALVAKHMIEHQFKTDELIRKTVAETPYALEISETVSSLIDRAAARAIALRAKRRPQR